MKMMKSDEYWINCAEKRMERYMNTADKTAEKIANAYKSMLDEISVSLESIYSKLTVGISVAEAKRILSKVETNDIEMFLNKAVESMTDSDKKLLLQKELKKSGMKSKIQQLKQLIKKIELACESISLTTTEMTTDCLNKLVPEAYYRSSYDIQKGTGIGLYLLSLTQEQIDEIRNTNWSGQHYSQRIENNSLKLQDILVIIAISGFLTMRNQMYMAETFAHKMAEAFTRSYTLLRTEADFVANQAELLSYKTKNIERYRYVAVLDLKTSKICRELDNKEFEVDKALIGINFPPMHPRCRSTTTPAIDKETMSKMTREAIDPQTGQVMTVPADMSYRDWYDKYVDSLDYMANSFRPEYQTVNDISYSTTNGKIVSLKVKKVTNSKFDIVTDREATRRNKAVRLVEKQLTAISSSLPEKFVLPQIAVVNFERAGLNTNAIGGYDKQTGILYINSKYNTPQKIVDFISENEGQFANKTQYAPLLHELGHKYYEDTIKILANNQEIEYNIAKRTIDTRVFNYIESKNDKDFIKNNLSNYANDGWLSGNFTEIVAESFTLKNFVAKDVLDLLR